MIVKVRIIAEIGEQNGNHVFAATDGGEVMNLLTNDEAAADELRDALIGEREVAAKCYNPNPRLTYKYKRKENK